MPYLQPRSGSVTLDATGAGTVTFSVDNTNQRWIIDWVTVQTNQAPAATPVPRVISYQNQVGAPAGFRGGSNSGNLDSAQGRVILYPDDILYFVWSGGIPGSVATAVIAGTFDPAGVPLQD